MSSACALGPRGEKTEWSSVRRDNRECSQTDDGRHPSTDSGSSGDTKKHKYQKNKQKLHIGISFSNYRKSKTKTSIIKAVRGEQKCHLH